MNVPLANGFELYISRESLKAALLISLLSVYVLIGVFAYLNRYTRRAYFTIWTGAWIFYGVWLTLHFLLLNKADPFWIMLKQWCVSVSAVFLLWGSVRFMGLPGRRLLFGLFSAFLMVWSYIGAYELENPLLIDLPIFGLIGLASIWAAVGFFQYRRKRNLVGAGLLGLGFLMWGGYFMAHAFFQHSEDMVSAGFFASAVLQLFIAVSMIILVLEEVRLANQLAQQKIQTQRHEKQVLQHKITSTEERYRSLFDQASEAIVIAAAEDLRILELNQTAERLLGVPRNEVGKHFLPAFCQFNEPGPSDSREIPDWIEKLSLHRQLNLIGRAGTKTPSEADGAPIDFEGQPAYQFFFRELTERSRLEQQLRQAEKLSALGQMISGIAHELNNPLAVIKGYLELVLAHHQLHPQTRADLEKVAHESSRATKLVRNFLAFSREQPAHREMVNMNDVVRRVAELRRFDICAAAVELDLDLAPDLPGSSADPDQIQQLIVNLVNNSLQALVEQPQPHGLRIATRQKNEAIEICIEDNGPGVPTELETRIFEPFFTTKEVGTGTGLGLSIAHSIMSDHRGRISYRRSSLGGACFTLEFPILTSAPEAAPPGAPAGSPATAAQIPGARVLVVDDEKSIAELLCEMLTMLGHDTTLCLNPRQALEAIEKQDFDLILSDFRMPYMNGQEFHQQLVLKKPALARRMIFLTGDVVNDETRVFLESTGNPNLAKPFQLTTLQQVVGEVLSRVEAESPKQPA